MTRAIATVLQGNQAYIVKFQETKISIVSLFSNKGVFDLTVTFFQYLLEIPPIYSNSSSSILAQTIFCLMLNMLVLLKDKGLRFPIARKSCFFTYL